MKKKTVIFIFSASSFRLKLLHLSRLDATPLPPVRRVFAEFAGRNLFFTLLMILFSISSLCASESDSTSDPTVLSSDISGQTAVSLTIYNVNMGLVKDERELNLPKGTLRLNFMDVASEIIPQSVYIKSITHADGFSVIEQNYEYDLLNPQKLLDKYVGKEVKLYSKNPYNEREEIVTATVLSNDGNPVFKIGDEITYGYPGRIIFPKVPENLISKPTLQWVIDNADGGLQKVEATYLTNGINWRADYVVVVNDTDTRTDLAGWVTIDNKSGSTYKNARLKLIAGDVNRVTYNRGVPAPAMAAGAMKSQREDFKEEGFFEYHMYTLQRPATVKNNQIKQIRLIHAENVSLKKEFIYSGTSNYFYSSYGDTISNQKVGVFLEIENKKDNNLGIPLPKGTLRVYKRDTEGSLQFIGEDSIDHTPKDEKFKIKMGEAFDIVATRKQTEWKKLALDTYEASYEISIRNHKKEGVTVKVIEPIPGDWKILKSSHEYKKDSSKVAEFPVKVPENGEVKLTYTVSMRY
ncbi:MAG: DUF4139 domain-containing protein [Nitrospirae bacterium]|nr:DUF4139 domain-containing protein [Nitrospirota bacterium]